jgi:hypothetical protein
MTAPLYKIAFDTVSYPKLSMRVASYNALRKNMSKDFQQANGIIVCRLPRGYDGVARGVPSRKRGVEDPDNPRQAILICLDTQANRLVVNTLVTTFGVQS